MKKRLLFLAACIFCLSLACANTSTKEPEPAPEIKVPETVDVTLTLPIGARDDITKTIPAYTAEFSEKNSRSLSYTVVSADPTVADAVLSDNGTLYVIAHATGETQLMVTAKNDSGAEGVSTVSVTVRDARRMLVLIVLGVLSVLLLVLFGKPSAKKPAPEKAPDVPLASGSDANRVVIEEPVSTPNENPERS